MKKIIILSILSLIIISCNKDKGFVTISGNVTNQTSDSLLIFHPNSSYKKSIKVNENGDFSDTLKVVNGLFSLTNNKDFSLLYLINGDNLIINFDSNNISQSSSFHGGHAEENNFLAKSVSGEKKLLSNISLLALPKNDFDLEVGSYVENFENRLNKANLDVEFKNYQKEEIVNFRKYLNKEYSQKNYNQLVLGVGKSAPKFVDYEDFKGGTVSLSDLKGKYVYIDVWATWCQPCKVEIPFLKRLENKYHDKNIEFVSVSIDDKKGYDAWRQMVKDKELGGIQLYAKGDRNFITEFRVNSIPRFILIDPKGNIVNSNAPKPSNPQLNRLLESLNL